MTTMTEKQITISKKLYDSLIEDSNVLHKLYAAGVDNWEWYGEALGNNEEDDDWDEDDEYEGVA